MACIEPPCDPIHFAEGVPQGERGGLRWTGAFKGGSAKLDSALSGVSI